MDALLHKAAEQVGAVRSLTVVTVVESRGAVGDDLDDSDYEALFCRTCVYPLDEQHLHTALGDDGRAEEAEWRAELPRDIPFYAYNALTESGVTFWRHADEEAANMSNEARDSDEHSIYLHWALIIS